MRYQADDGATTLGRSDTVLFSNYKHFRRLDVNIEKIYAIYKSMLRITGIQLSTDIIMVTVYFVV
jgi:hypothetical protein